MKLCHTRPALGDLDGILEYLELRSPKGARNVQRRIKKSIQLPLDHPFIGTRTDDSAIRRMVATPYPYLAYYEVAAGEIVIHTIRHAARDQWSKPS